MEIKQIGNMDNDRKNFKNPQCGMVCDSEGLSSTINTCQGDQREPKIIVKTVPLGNLNGHKLGSNYAGSVYDENGLAPAINTMGGGNREPMIVAMRGRNPDNPSDRTAGIPTEQRLEPNCQGICNCLTNVRKDNMVLESIVAIDEQNKNVRVETFGTLTTDGSSPKHNNRVMECYQSCYRIRKLTPLECWRLMSFSDDDFNKAAAVNSNTQLYKQAGNSIVENVLIAIFGQMIPEKGKENYYE